MDTRPKKSSWVLFVFVFMFVFMFEWTHVAITAYVVVQPAGSTASGAGNGTAAPMFDSCRSLIGCGMVEGRCHGGTAQAWQHSHLACGTAAAAKSKHKAAVQGTWRHGGTVAAQPPGVIWRHMAAWRHT